MRQKLISIILTGCVLVIYLAFVPTATAETIVNLPVTPIAQRFYPADTNGDTGIHDCMAAAFTTAVLTLYDTGNLGGERQHLTYSAVRRLLRNWSPDINHGIAPAVIIAATPTVTKLAFSLSMQHVDPAFWKPFLKTELAAGRPVIVHIADRNALYSLPPRNDASHVIVVYGMDSDTVSFTDSWDGSAHTISHAQFAYAWSQGYHNWLAFPFVPNHTL